MHVAYFTNQYPKVSHSFIRREILAVERAGLTVSRIALRSPVEELVDPDDLAERRKTHYLLDRGLSGLLPSMARVFARAPTAFMRALRMAWRLSRMSERTFAYHLVYLAEACALIRHCEQRGVDHVHVHFGTNPTEVALLARLMGGPSYSFTVHGPDEFDRPQGLHLGEKIAAASHVVAISSYGRSQLFRWTEHHHWPKIRVVHCGLEASFLEMPASMPASAIPRLVCVGRLCEQKGQLLLLDAARQLRDSGAVFQLVLAGDGEMRSALESYIKEHHLEPVVTITGWISSERVKQELIAARTMVLASFAEGLPVVIMEAMALRRPVLSTSIAGIPELVRHGEEGWLVPAGDVEALLTAMQESLQTTDASLARMGAMAHNRVTQRHEINTEAAKLVRLFQEATCRPR